MVADPYVKDKGGLTSLDCLLISESGAVKDMEYRRQTVQNWLPEGVPRVVNARDDFYDTAIWYSTYSESELSYKDAVDEYNRIKMAEVERGGVIARDV